MCVLLATNEREREREREREKEKEREVERATYERAIEIPKLNTYICMAHLI
jgi:hypothetical protein